MGKIDRIIRFIIAILIGILYAQEIIGGSLAIVLGIVALIFIATSFVSFCPLYRLVGLSTCPTKK